MRADEALASLGLSRSACADLYDEDLRVHRRVMRYRALCDENGVLTLLPTDFAAEVIQYDDSVLPETASPASVKLGLFKNRQLIAWAEELDAQPDSFHGFEGYTFYCTPKSYVPCTPGDIFSEAVLITDQFGRQLICEAISGTYVLAEDGTLEWPPDDYHYNAPLSDWNFG